MLSYLPDMTMIVLQLSRSRIPMLSYLPDMTMIVLQLSRSRIPSVVGSSLIHINRTLITAGTVISPTLANDNSTVEVNY